MVTASFTDYYQLLSLEPEWDTERLRKALLDAFRGNQGRINAVTGSKREEIEQRQALIPKAKKILLDPDVKAKYDQELAQWKRTATPFEVVATIPTLAELWKLIDAGRYLDAVEGGKKLVEHTRNDYLAWEVYARANYYRKDYRTAINAAEKAIGCSPQKAELYADASEYLAADQQWDQAVIQLNRAIQLEPNNSNYKLELASIYIGHEVWADAEAVLNGILSQDSANSTARYFMAIVINDRAAERLSEVDDLVNSGKKGQARKILKEIKLEFEKAQKLAGNNLDLLELLSSNSTRVRRWLGINFYYRLFGFALDGVLASPGFFLMTIDGGTNQLAMIAGAIFVLGIWGYSWIWLAYKNSGQDLTKRLLGMQIVSDNDLSINLNQLIIRATIKPINCFFAYMIMGTVILFSTMGELGKFGEVADNFLGLMIWAPIVFFRLFWELFFVTNKDLMPTFFGSALFMHEKVAGTTVVEATKDDVMNFGAYHWF